MSLFAIPPIGISSPNPVLLPMVTLITSTSGQAGRCLEISLWNAQFMWFCLSSHCKTLYRLYCSAEIDPQSCYSEQQLNLVQDVCFYLLPTEITRSGECSPVLVLKLELATLCVSHRKDGGRILLFMNMFISICKVVRGIFYHKFFPSL